MKNLAAKFPESIRRISSHACRTFHILWHQKLFHSIYALLKMNFSGKFFTPRCDSTVLARRFTFHYQG